MTDHTIITLANPTTGTLADPSSEPFLDPDLFTSGIRSDFQALSSKLRKFYVYQNEHINNLQIIHHFLKYSSGLEVPVLVNNARRRSKTISVDSGNGKDDDRGQDGEAEGDGEGRCEESIGGPAALKVERQNARHAFVINLCFGVNVFLFVIKVVASLSTGSVSVLASCVDSLLDLLSGESPTLVIFSFSHIFISFACQNRCRYFYNVVCKKVTIAL
jgi:hypothetical protein